MLYGHLLVRRHQDHVVETPARKVQIVPVLQYVGVHQQGFAGTGRALEGDGTQVIRPVLRHGGGEAISLPVAVQIGTQRCRVRKVPVQVVLGEQKGDVLMRLPGAAVLTGHPQSLAVRGDVGSVFGQQIGGYTRPAGQVDRQNRSVVVLPARRVDRRFAQASQHCLEVAITELPTHELVQHQPILQRGIVVAAAA